MVMAQMHKHTLYHLLGIRRLVTPIYNKARLCVSLVSSSMECILLLDSFQRMGHSEYILYSSRPMGSHLNTDFIVVHTKQKQVCSHS